MHEYASRELLAPGSDGWHINGKRIYARIFIKFVLRTMVARPAIEGIKDLS